MSVKMRRILCAESHEDISELIARMLKEKGYVVKTAQTVAETLNLATTEKFDLYIVNDTYIDGDSFELMRQLRALDPAVPVLLFSLEGYGKYQDEILKAGAQYYVTRTSDFSSLVQTIDSLLRSGGIPGQSS